MKSANDKINVPFILYFNLITLEAGFNGSATLQFILDTGAQATIIDTDAAIKAGLEYRNLNAQAGGAGAEILSVGAAADVMLDLSGSEIFFDQMLVVPVGQVLSSYIGKEINGILGYDFISRFVVEIDYAEGRISLYDPQTYQYSGKGEVIPITVANNHPHLQAELDLPGFKGGEADLIIDTGASPSLVLFHSFVKAGGIMTAGLKTVPVLNVGAGGPSPAAVARIEELRFGKTSIKDLTTSLSLFENDAVAQMVGADGVLGAEILRRFTVIFDYSRNRMILEPNNLQDDPFEDAVTGLLLKAEGADFEIIRVAGVADDSPAADAGMCAGDRILEIDGFSVEGSALESVIKRFSLQQPYDLLIERGNEQLNLSLTPLKC